MPTLAIRTAPAQPVWFGSDDDPQPVTIANVSATANLWVGSQIGVQVGDTLHSTLIPPGGYLSLDGTDNYWIVADAPNALVALYPGVTSFFLPTSLVTLGGVKIFNTSTAPTQPPPIPVNSLWFAPDGSINVWNGSAWVAQTFSGSALITANTITANQLAAGIIYAGIVDGTLINAANIQFANGWLSNGDGTFTNKPGLFLYNGTPAANNMFSSTCTAAGTDKFGNAFLAGHTDYRQTASGYVAVSIVPSTGTGQIAWYTSVTMAGPWTFAGGLDAYSVPQVINGNDGQTYIYGHSLKRVGSNIPITSTTPATLLSFTVAPGWYKIFSKVLFSSATGTVQPFCPRLAGNCVLDVVAIETALMQVGISGANLVTSEITAQNADPNVNVNLGNSLSYRFELEGHIHVSTAGGLLLTGRQGTSSASEQFTVGTNTSLELTPES